MHMPEEGLLSALQNGTDAKHWYVVQEDIDLGQSLMLTASAVVGDRLWQGYGCVYVWWCKAHTWKLHVGSWVGGVLL